MIVSTKFGLFSYRCPVLSPADIMLYHEYLLYTAGGFDVFQAAEYKYRMRMFQLHTCASLPCQNVVKTRRLNTHTSHSAHLQVAGRTSLNQLLLLHCGTGD